MFLDGSFCSYARRLLELFLFPLFYVYWLWSLLSSIVMSGISVIFYYSLVICFGIRTCRLSRLFYLAKKFLFFDGADWVMFYLLTLPG